MIRRSTWMMVVVFVALVGLAWYLQRQGGPEEITATPTPSPGYLFEVAEEDIVRLRIDGQDGRQVEVARDEEAGWSLVVPQAEATDQGRVTSAVTQSAALRIIALLENPPGPEAIGLAPPAYIVSLDLADGSERVVEVGALTPTGSGYYARLSGEAPVILNRGALEVLLRLLDEPPIATPTPATPEQTATHSPPN